MSRKNWRISHIKKTHYIFIGSGKVFYIGKEVKLFNKISFLHLNDLFFLSILGNFACFFVMHYLKKKIKNFKKKLSGILSVSNNLDPDPV